MGDKWMEIFINSIQTLENSLLPERDRNVSPVNLRETMKKIYQREASLIPKFQPKIMFYAVLNWKRVQFSESHQFWWILDLK